MNFQEHNNRKIAREHAEFITGEALRRFVAHTVRRFASDRPSVLDGAAGSGQLEQFIEPSEFEAVEIQAAACQALRQNYPQAAVHNTSFFLYQPERQMDCAVMNPPFSIKFKELTGAEQIAVQQMFPWKKSGKVDDIFILKSLQHVRRWSFQIAFPCIAYRNTEARMRQTIGNRLAELWTIENAFEDTAISVILIVIDKEKTEPHYRSAFYDCADGKIHADTGEVLNDTCDWVQARKPSAAPEIKDFDMPASLTELAAVELKHLELSLQWHLQMLPLFGQHLDFTGLLNEIRRICDKYEGLHKQAEKETP